MIFLAGPTLTFIAQLVNFCSLSFVTFPKNVAKVDGVFPLFPSSNIWSYLFLGY